MDGARRHCKPSGAGCREARTPTPKSPSCISVRPRGHFETRFNSQAMALDKYVCKCSHAKLLLLLGAISVRDGY